jgi:hypothetical protein
MRRFAPHWISEDEKQAVFQNSTGVGVLSEFMVPRDSSAGGNL